jgi:hypothetical protein
MSKHDKVKKNEANEQTPRTNHSTTSAFISFVGFNFSPLQNPSKVWDKRKTLTLKKDI